MADIKVVTPDDMGKSITLSGAGKYEAISQVAFTEREATVDLPINGMKLIFRELANSNRDMVCTGIKYQGAWYGDAPDTETAQNPFTGAAVLQPQPITQSGLTWTDVDGTTVVRNAQGKLSSQQPPIVYNVAFDAAAKSITVPTGATNAVLFLTRADTGTLQNITGGVQGQIIYIRYANGITIENTNSVRLMNGKASPTALDSNKVSSFLCLAPGVWTELTRNFT